MRAFNEDLPFDRFARMQLAGDVLEPGFDGAAAVGFLVAGVHNTVLPANPLLKEQARQDELEGIVGTVSQAFLGLTAHCARCHDHRTDPIATEDYYRLASVLAGVYHGEREVETEAGKTKLFTVLARDPGSMRVHLRGSAASLGEEVEPGGLSALRSLDPRFGPSSLTDAERRRAAGRLGYPRPENPLFARVAVNRVWHHHFGAGLVETPNDFGRNGGPPEPPRAAGLAGATVRGGRLRAQGAAPADRDLRGLPTVVACAPGWPRPRRGQPAAVALVPPSARGGGPA